MPQAITLDQFRASLSDPNEAIAVIMGNNPEAVADNLNDMGFLVSNPQNMLEALQAMLDNGAGDKFIQALTVPIRQDRMTPEQIAIVTQQAAAMTRVAGGSAKSFDLNAAFAGLATGALYYLNQTGAAGNTANAAPAAPKPPEEKDNTLLYVGIGVGAILLLVVIIMLMKKGK